ncbi:MAG: DciA family protein [bacterium]|nr:DciA family protein [bacterium]
MTRRTANPQFRAEPRGGARPVSLGEGLRRAVAALGIEPRLLEQRVLLLLPEVIREIAGTVEVRTTRPPEIRRGELLISVQQDALRHRLLFERERIRGRLNKAVNKEVVRSIRFGR